MSPKDEVRQLLDRLPADVSLEEIQYHIYVKQKVERALAAAERGEILSEEEVDKRMDRHTAQEIYSELDLGPGGYAVAPSTESRDAVRKAIRRKHGR